MVYAEKRLVQKAIEVTAKLRRAGLAANFCYKFTNLSKQLKQASAQKARRCIILGEELKAGQLVIKDMESGRQELVDINEFLAEAGSEAR